MKSNINLIAIGGGSASGKTTVARLIAARLGKDQAVILEMDSYYRDRSHLSEPEREQINFDHPEAMDLELFGQHLIELKNGRAIDKPIYNFHTHQLEARTERFAPRPVVVAEGLFILADQFRDTFSYRIFIDTPEDVRLARRIARDVKERGRTKDAVLKQYAATVKPMHEAFVAPTAGNADVVMSWEKENIEAVESIVENIKELFRRK